MPKKLSEKQAERIGRTLGKLPPEATPRKDVRLDLRISELERKEMQAMAGRLGLSVSGYVLWLHRQAVQNLRGQSS